MRPAPQEAVFCLLDEPSVVTRRARSHRARDADAVEIFEGFFRSLQTRSVESRREALPPGPEPGRAGPKRFAQKVTPVGFEPTPFRNGALSHRLRPLGQSVLPWSGPPAICQSGRLLRYALRGQKRLYAPRPLGGHLQFSSLRQHRHCWEGRRWSDEQRRPYRRFS